MSQTKKFEATFIRRGITEAREEEVLEEEALQIAVDDKEFSMTMRTPGDDRFLIRGLLYSQGLAPNGFLDYEEQELAFGTFVNVGLEEDVNSQRQLMATSSCGVCGEKNLDRLFDGLVKINRQLSFDAKQISTFYSALSRRQKLFKKTGGSHCAAAFTLEGDLLCSFEDIGRHNAVDKVIGWLLENNRLKEADALVVSSRISYEIVQKCILAGIPVLTGISAPSSLAVEMAQRFELTLAAFCRNDKATFYAGTQRVVEQLNLV